MLWLQQRLSSASHGSFLVSLALLPVFSKNWVPALPGPFPVDLGFYSFLWVGKVNPAWL